MKKIFFLSIFAALFLCSACTGLNDKIKNGSMSFETTEFPNQNSSGNENLPGNTHYFEITITNIQTKAQQVVYMNQNEKQFIELEPGKYSIYIFGQTDDCEYEWQSDDENPIVIKENEITAVAAKMWEKDPEFWFEQEKNKYIPINDNIAPEYNGRLEAKQIFAFWVNQDDAKETVKAGEKISGKISKKFIPHFLTPEALVLNFKQTENQVSETTAKVYLDYSCSSDCQIKYLVNPVAKPENESAFANASVYDSTSGIDFATTSDMLTIYAIALPKEGDILHTASPIASLDVKRVFGNMISFEKTTINAEDSKLQFEYDYEIYVDENTKECVIKQNFNIVNIQDYDSDTIKWYTDNKGFVNNKELSITYNIPSNIGNDSYYEDFITCIAKDKNNNYDFINYSDYFEITDFTGDSYAYINLFGEDDYCSFKVDDEYVDGCIWIFDGKVYDKVKVSMDNNGKSLICIYKNNYYDYDAFWVCKTIVDIH